VRKGFRTAFFAGIGLALLCLISSLVCPSLIRPDYDRKSLDRLKRRARDVRTEFAAVLAAHNQKGLPAFGIDLVPDAAPAAVEADFLIGQDGLPRAIRLASTRVQ